MVNNIGKWLKCNPVLAILLFVAGLFFAYYLYFAVRWLFYNVSIDYGEGFVMNYARMWANGTWKWDITTPPYFTMVYNIGHTLLILPLVKVFGAQLWVGRIVSIVAALVACWMVYLVVKEITGKKIYAILAALLPATQPLFRDWSVMARVDMPAVMFDMLGVYSFMKLKDTKWWYVPTFAFVIASTIKLTAIAGLIAVIIYYFIINWRKAIHFVAVVGLEIVILFGIMSVASGGEYLKHVITYQNTIENIDIPTFMVLFKGMFPAFIILFMLSVVYLRRYLKDKKITLVGLFFVIAFVIDMITSMRAGAALMYYYELIIAGCICSALVIERLIAKRKLQAIKVYCGAIIVIGLLYGIHSSMGLPSQQYADDINGVKKIISDTQRPVITENAAIAVDLNKQIYVEPFIFTNLSRMGYWDATNYDNQIKNQYFDYIILKVSLEKRIPLQPDGDFTNQELEYMNQNYTLIYKNDTQDWRLSTFLYESNDRAKNDNRVQLINGQYYRRLE